MIIIDYFKHKFLTKRKIIFNKRLRNHMLNVLNDKSINMNFDCTPLSYYWGRYLDDSNSIHYDENIKIRSYCNICYKKHSQIYYANECCKNKKVKDAGG